LLVERDEGVALNARVDDQKILVEHRRGPGAPAVNAFADEDMPDLFAVQTETENTRLAEEDIQLFAVGDRRARGVALIRALAAVAMLRQHGCEILRTYRPAVLPIDAPQVQTHILLDH